MFSDYVAEMKKGAVDAFPFEAVWLITKSGCVEVANVASDSENEFEVSVADLESAIAEGLLAVVHSHPNHPAYPSKSDMRGQVSTGVPWGIICTNGTDAEDPFWWGLSDPEPLVGRGFRHGVTDCYSLIRDYYLVERGVTLPEFPRSWEWWESGEDLYLKGFKSAGFRLLEGDEEPSPHDVWFSQVNSKVPNHGGIYLGGELILHHTTARKPVSLAHLSRSEPIHRWMPYITHWLRYEGL